MKNKCDITRERERDRKRAKVREIEREREGELNKVFETSSAIRKTPIQVYI